jgi:hypothetical protein
MPLERSRAQVPKDLDHIARQIEKSGNIASVSDRDLKRKKKREFCQKKNSTQVVA